MWPFRKAKKTPRRRRPDIGPSAEAVSRYMPPVPTGKIKRVSIDERGCCAHTLCEAICPQVFAMGPKVAQVRADAHLHYETAAQAIFEAVDCCPVDAIRLEVEPKT